SSLSADSLQQDIDPIVHTSSNLHDYVRPIPTNDSPVGAPHVCFLCEKLVLWQRLAVRVSKHKMPVRFFRAGVAHVDEDYHSLSRIVSKFEDWFQSPLPACDWVDDYAIKT